MAQVAIARTTTSAQLWQPVSLVLQQVQSSSAQQTSHAVRHRFTHRQHLGTLSTATTTIAVIQPSLVFSLGAQLGTVTAQRSIGRSTHRQAPTPPTRAQLSSVSNSFCNENTKRRGRWPRLSLLANQIGTGLAVATNVNVEVGPVMHISLGAENRRKTFAGRFVNCS